MESKVTISLEEYDKLRGKYDEDRNELERQIKALTEYSDELEKEKFIRCEIIDRTYAHTLGIKSYFEDESDMIMKQITIFKGTEMFVNVDGLKQKLEKKIERNAERLESRINKEMKPLEAELSKIKNTFRYLWFFGRD